MKHSLLIIISALASISSYAQNTGLKVSGFLEAYYGYDFNKPSSNNRPGFVYSHNRHNEVNLNLGLIKGNYDNGNIRANLAVMAGTYSNANMTAETGVLKNIFEANAGLKLSKNQNLWVDAGIFSSHIGFESAISKDNWVLTRNISSENTPYYEAGVKLTYESNNHQWLLSALYLNGWQRITRQDGNNQPAGGLQLTFKPTEKIALNYSNYLGTEGPDSTRVSRYYNNLYGIFQLTKTFGLTVGVDYGVQQQTKGSAKYNSFFSPVAIARYQFKPKWGLAGRVEYYSDENGVIISNINNEGFKAYGYSLNIDYNAAANTIVRLEGKSTNSKDAIFQQKDNFVKHNAVLTASIAIAF